MTPRFSVIVATIGRPSLTRALQSLADQPLAADDQVLVVGHGDAISDAAVRRGYTFLPCPPGGNWGAVERRRGMLHATGTHLVFLDDDDIFLPGAFAAMRTGCAAHPGRPLMFRMIAPWGDVIWREPTVRCGNHGGPQFVTPNDPARLGQWSSRYVCDYDFCVSTLAHYPPDALVWDSTVTYLCRPKGEAVA
jgi:glycosyltransferase involved in cell wall biosynthesis